MPNVSVTLAQHQYDVVIECAALDRLGELVRAVAPHRRCALLCDESVMRIHGQRAAASLRRAGYDVVAGAMPSGEQHKNLDSVRRFYDLLLDHRLERASPVIALGGGVTGDTVGFVAATYLRGVPFIQVPTSLLAMVDASVGGKVGVDTPQGKNLIGAFHQPSLVVVDPLALQTLPPRQLRCGLAECVKHGMIRDPDLFDFIAWKLPGILAIDPAVMTDLLARNVRIKAAVVMRDEKETGERAHLNFGHTFAHAVESVTGYEHVQHGEAVALGMVAATGLATALGLCDPLAHAKLTHLLSAVGLPVQAALPETERLMEAMKSDKKVKDDRIRFILPTRIGQVVIRDDVPTHRVIEAWNRIRAA
jgi:3-dehydroquinate synthase